MLQESFKHRQYAACSADQASSGLIALPAASGDHLKSPATTGCPNLDYEEQMRDVARIMEILSKGGYHCELAMRAMH